MLTEIRRGNRRALARLLTAVENDRASVTVDLSKLCAFAADAAVIGVTGAPGVGKSVLVAALTKLLRKREQTVAIVAVDPSSPFSGGAILGDRIRMRELAGDRGVFIRSMANRGQLGGLAWATQDVVRVLAAAGFDYVIVETVGAGQSEVDIARLADTTVVVVAPGAGDGVQSLKAGILEIADILVVNKCDMPGAETAARTLNSMLEFNHPGKQPADAHPPWTPPIVRTSALHETGLEELAQCLAEHQKYLCESGLLDAQRSAGLRSEFEARLRESWVLRLFDTFAPTEFTGIIECVAAREIDPQSAVDALLAQLNISRLE